MSGTWPAPENRLSGAGQVPHIPDKRSSTVVENSKIVEKVCDVTFFRF
jgi:hypothetical protein